MNKSQASKFIKVSEEFSEIFPGKNLGLTVMYELATLPNDIREEPQELSNGEVKKPSDMTRKELEDLKRQLKQREAFIGCDLFYLQHVKTLYFRKF